MTPATLPLRAQRWTPFVYVIDFEGYDFSAATFAMQVRQYRDAPGDPLVSLVNAAAGAQGISAAVAFDGDGVPTTSVTIRINETTLEGLLPFAVTDGVPNRKAGSDLDLVWDLHITASGMPKTRWLEGPFTLRAGATQ